MRPKYQLNTTDRITNELITSIISGTIRNIINFVRFVTALPPRSKCDNTFPVFRPKCHRNDKFCKREKIFISVSNSRKCSTISQRNV